MIFEMIQEVLSKPKEAVESIFPKTQAIKILKCGRVPRHVGFIMDGNRRYAKERHLPTREGYRMGIETLVSNLEVCFNSGIEEVSVYAFSIENFKRPEEEVDEYQNLLMDALKKITEKSLIKSYDVGIHLVGNKSLIDSKMLADLERIERLSNSYQVTRIFNVCFSYTSRDEISNSIKDISVQREIGSLKKQEINERLIIQNFYGSTSNSLDLLIRTSGHMRLSDFMLWQCSSDCKIIFLDKFWPELNFRDIYYVILNWSLEKANIRGNHIVRRFWNPQRHVDVRLLPTSPPFATVSSLLKEKDQDPELNIKK